MSLTKMFMHGQQRSQIDYYCVEHNKPVMMYFSYYRMPTSTFGNFVAKTSCMIDLMIDQLFIIVIHANHITMTTSEQI